MSKKLTILLIIGYFTMIFNSCSFSEIDQNCTAKFTDFEILILDFSKTPIWETNDVINKDSFGFQINMKDVVVEKPYKNLGCYEISHNNSISSLTIKTIYDYSDIIPAGSDITELFAAKNQYYTSEFITIDKLIPDLENFRNNINHYHFYLIDDTCKSGQQNFEITIILSDNTVLVKQTGNLLID